MKSAVALFFVSAALVAGASVSGQKRPMPAAAMKMDPACAVKAITRAPDGLVVWSADGTQYFVNRKDRAGIYQLYVGKKGAEASCITCTSRPNGPLPTKHKLQPHWHPSGRWIELAVEWEKVPKPLLATRQLIEGWLQSGIWVDMYVVRPDGSEWHRLSDFEHHQKEAGGYTGVAFTPDGRQGVWAQIIESNFFRDKFGRWQLILADFREDSKGVPSFSNLRNITPGGANWVEIGNFAPDGRSLLLSADIGMSDAQGMDQYILDITSGAVVNLTNSPEIWDEHGVFSPDGRKIFFMSSYPFRDNRLRHTVLFLHTEFMLMNRDGSGLQQVTHFNFPGYPESNTRGRGSVAAIGEWSPDGRSICALNLFFPAYETWTITFAGTCGRDPRL